MSRKSKILNFEISETLEESLSIRSKNPKHFRKIQLLYLIKSNTYSSMGDIENALSTNRNSLNTWLDKYSQFGINSLLIDNRKTKAGRKYSIPDDAKKALIEKLNSTEGFPSYKEALIWFNSTFNLSIKYVSFWNFVHYKLGATLKVARPSHVKKTKIV